MDRFVKNTYEILSPLNELTSQMRMTQHQFLTADRLVRRTVFGDGPAAVEVIVNGSPGNYRHQSPLGGQVQLPPYGFVIESAAFTAFCALGWNGLTYDSPTLFCLRSLDGRPIAQSSQVRIFHGFGDTRIKLGATERKVEKEEP
jgi:hypothetical protein